MHFPAKENIDILYFLILTFLFFMGGLFKIVYSITCKKTNTVYIQKIKESVCKESV